MLGWSVCFLGGDHFSGKLTQHSRFCIGDLPTSPPYDGSQPPDHDNPQGSHGSKAMAEIPQSMAEIPSFASVLALRLSPTHFCCFMNSKG